MKKIIILLVFIFLGITNYQAQSWEWEQPTSDSKILKDMDDNVYVFSNASSSFTIRKLNIYGTTLWTKTGTGNAVISAYKIDGNNDLIVLGNLTSSATISPFTLAPLGTQSFFILKIAPTSTVLSANVYGSPDKTFANDLFITSTGDYLIGGGFSGTFDINGSLIVGDSLQNLFIVKIDGHQNLLWSEKSTMYTSSGESWLKELVETPSGKIYAELIMIGGLVDYKGFQFSSSGQYLIQLDNSRNITWKYSMGYPGLTFNWPSDIQTSNDTVYMKEYMLAPHFTYSSIYMWTDSGIRTSKSFSSSRLGYEVANGKVYYAYALAIGILSPSLSDETADSISPVDSYSEVQYINATSLYISGQDGSSGAPFVGKFNRSTITSVIANNENNQFQVFPNPTSGQFTMKIDEGLQKQVQHGDMIFVFDQIGNCVLRQQFSNSVTQQIDISKMAKGIYFIEVESGNPSSQGFEGQRERINKKIILN